MSTRRTVRIVGFVLKTLFSLLVLSVCALLIWRIFFSTKEPALVDDLYVNAPLYEAYQREGKDMVIKYQNQFSMTYAEDNAGYFGISEYVIIPGANQIQVVLRYNNSTLDHLQKDYSLPARPEKGSDLFDLTLRQIVDLTPLDSSDNNDLSALSITRHTPSHIIVDTTALYTYYRLVFDNVVIDENDVSSIMLDIYYKGDLDYEKDAYGAILLYDNLGDWFDYDLTSGDKKALEAYKKD